MTPSPLDLPMPLPPLPFALPFPTAAQRRHDRLPHPCRDEGAVVQALVARLPRALAWPAVEAVARPWVVAVREQPAPFWAMASLLRDFPISHPEGLALMRLAEALLRVPDRATAIALTADQLGRADFDAPGDGGHALAAGVSAQVIALAKQVLPDANGAGGLLQRLGSGAVVAATVRAIRSMGRQFVLGDDMAQALAEAGAARRDAPRLRFSFDMLGEGARTDADAQRHLAAYLAAVDRLAVGASAPHRTGTEDRDGLSVKLSALFPRFEEAQRDRVATTLLPRAWALVARAAAADLPLTFDAEESDRLELTLDVLEALAAGAARAFPGWRGLGLAVQAYQPRVVEAIDAVARIARAHGQRLMVRLVKGAYWDSEVKRAQELGLPGYPVFTHKHHTDIAYLAGASTLLDHADVLYPQFATHNAGTLAAVVTMARDRGARFEVQRLHGMGEALHQAALPSGDWPLRVYAPVGDQRDLLAYLVRRLLENGANTSFVHQLADDAVPLDVLLASPLRPASAPGLPLPVALYDGGGVGGTGGAEGPVGADGATRRRNPVGADLAVHADREALERALHATHVPSVAEAAPADARPVVDALHAAFPAWDARPQAERTAVLRRAADLLEGRQPAFCGLLVREARKTLGDAVAEVREAIDFCRYYAGQAEARLAPQVLPGPTGESNTLHLHGRGVFVCISPWNFPLAIFAGQVVAALVAGNTVAAKPAEQTPAVAAAFVALLHEAGLPADVLRLQHGPGDTVGAALVAHPRTAGVCFTGSSEVARHIHRALADRPGPIVPLIAETGGINAMVVDSTALPEQVVDAVVQSAFRSAGQRCSALRLLCLHDGIADAVEAMLAGALGELQVGDPALHATDVGPLIDADAHRHVAAEVARLDGAARLVGRTPLPDGLRGHFVAPVAFEVDGVDAVTSEIFGPVLQVVRWSGDPDAVIDAVNALGYGLTLGLQTRIDSRAAHLAARARVGNVYVNRNMVGAVVGVQPFGGQGRSGTGPKAGGPHYLYRFCTERTVTVNTAAAGGNAALFTRPAAA